jgi:hypothetical protein
MWVAFIENFNVAIPVNSWAFTGSSLAAMTHDETNILTLGRASAYVISFGSFGSLSAAALAFPGRIWRRDGLTQGGVHPFGSQRPRIVTANERFPFVGRAPTSAFTRNHSLLSFLDSKHTLASHRCQHRQEDI